MSEAPISQAPDAPASAPPAAPSAAAPAPSAAPAAAAPSEPWYSSFGLDDNARAFIAGKGFTNIGDLVKSGMEADRLVRDRNIMNAPDADPVKRKEWDGFERLGWTKERADYQVESPKAPDGMGYDSDLEKVFLDAAHSARVPSWQAKEILDAVAAAGFKAQDNAISKAALETQQLNAALDKEWGKDASLFRERARAAASYMGIGAEDAAQLEKVVGAPGLVKFFAKLGGMLGEDTLKGGASGGAARAGMTPDGSRAEMQRLQGDKEFVASLRDPSHPNHQANVARWNELIDLSNRK